MILFAVLLIPWRYEPVHFSSHGRELNITTRACFHVCDCRVAILLEIAMFSSFHRNKCSSRGPEAPGTCRVPHGARGSFDAGLSRSWYVNTCIHADFLHKHSHTWKVSTHINMQTLTPRPPPHATCCLRLSSPLPKLLIGPNKQARGACLFTSWQQVNILHWVPSCWKSGQCMGDMASVKTVNNLQVCYRKERWQTWHEHAIKRHIQ